MGLPGSGKSYLSEKLAPLIDAIWLNADQVRNDANDWDFSNEGRIRQSKRMNDLATKVLNKGKHVIADFVCPTAKTRSEFKPDFLIWMNTIREG